MKSSSSSTVDLSGLDVSKITPAQAGNYFNREVIETVRGGKDFISAWADCRTMYPAIFSRMCQLGDPAQAGSPVNPVDGAAAIANALTVSEYKSAFQTELGKCGGDPIKAHRQVMTKPEYSGVASQLAADNNRKAGALPNAVPAGQAFYLPMLKLPSNTPADVFKVAWNANGGKATPLDATAVFKALTGFFMGKLKISHDSADAYVREQFPNLAAVVDGGAS